MSVKTRNAKKSLRAIQVMAANMVEEARVALRLLAEEQKEYTFTDLTDKTLLSLEGPAYWHPSEMCAFLDGVCVTGSYTWDEGATTWEIEPIALPSAIICLKKFGYSKVESFS